MRAARGILVFGLCLASCAQAQVVINPPPGNDTVRDTSEWRAWSGLTLAWKPVKRIQCAFTQQARWADDLTSFDRHFQQLELEWDPKWNKRVEAHSLSFGIRHTSKPDNKGEVQGVDRYLRWQFDYGLNLGLARWEISGRVRYQRQVALALKDGGDPDSFGRQEAFRLKGSVGYNIKGWKLDPEFAVERFALVQPEGWEPDGSWRMRLGTSFKPGKRQKLKAFIQWDGEGQYFPTELGVPLAAVGAGIDDIREHGAVEWTVGFGWRYRFKSPKRSKKGLSEG